MSNLVIIDTDPGVDDAFALLVAGTSPELEVPAVTAVSGNVPVALAAEHASRLLPVAWGGRTPPSLHRGVEYSGITAEHVHGSDGLGGASRLTDAGRERYPRALSISSEPATDAILRLAGEHPGAVTLLTLGPLTNAAAAFRQAPGQFRHLREIVAMGGAFREPGNVTPVAEYNVYADPEAAQTVLESGVPLRWVPLDVTHRCVMSEADFDALPDTPRARLVLDTSGVYRDFHARDYGERGFILHDPVAVGAVLWPELFHTETRPMQVETRGTYTRGMTVADFRPRPRRTNTPEARICLGVDASEVVR